MTGKKWTFTDSFQLVLSPNVETNVSVYKFSKNVAEVTHTINSERFFSRCYFKCLISQQYDLKFSLR